MIDRIIMIIGGAPFSPKLILDGGWVLGDKSVQNMYMGGKRSFDAAELGTDVSMRASKKIRLDTGEPKISATKTRNYMLNDPLLDWLEQYGAEQGFKKNVDKYKHQLFKEGHEYEAKIIADLCKRFSGQIEYIKTGVQFEQRVIRTKVAISEGVPIIYQGGVENRKTGTFGIPDLIVKSSFLQQLFPDKVFPIDDKTGCASTTDSYIIIDIKHSTLDFSKLYNFLSNAVRYQPYKAQVIIYTDALADMMGCETMRWAYIWGKNGLGVVDLEGRDADCKVKTYNAVKWYRDMLVEGGKWNVWTPHRIELTPNMCNSDPEWGTTKYKLAFHQGELTLLWKVGAPEKNTLWENGFKSWRNRRFSVSMLRGAKDEGYKRLMEQCLEVNRAADDESAELTYLPKMLDKHPAVERWRTDKLTFYVDFETANNLIFMIGIGTEAPNGKWSFIHFTAEELTTSGERQLLERWIEFINGFPEVRLVHWTDAEPTHHMKALQRHNLTEIPAVLTALRKIEWADLYKLFIEIPISVRGAFNYGLKPIAKSLHESGLISSTWDDSGLKSGLAAMLLVKELESTCISSAKRKITRRSPSPPKRKRLMDIPLMQTIVDYNEMDCKVLYCILNEFILTEF